MQEQEKVIGRQLVGQVLEREAVGLGPKRLVEVVVDGQGLEVVVLGRNRSRP